MTAYYNEFDAGAAAWLRELIANGLIAPGDVDERSITDVKPDDLKGYDQCHFFAGIGGWSHALRLARVPDDYPVWTGSCPCQPFSSAGKGLGYDDERNLWWAFFHLISECRPTEIFGEQVASKDGLKWWFDLVSPDLEGAGYVTAAADLCGPSVGAPHIRQRLYFTGRLAHAGSQGWQEQHGRRIEPERLAATNGAAIRLADADGGERDGRADLQQRDVGDGENTGRSQDQGDATEHGVTDDTRATDGFWRDVDWLWCRDGKWRPVEPGTFPLADGVPERVGLLRGYGNAIIPQVAQAFIEAVRSC
ncbi:DNA cytosine methyltransferase [Sedimentitalea sp. JM2-8]|uniref:DNA cytosine methyltransferase n=1 Tax=Sedimentitalea xiamensis TaxID=3050037 RepID=A0ABT7FJ48_9RHOB|nr:DNA cytosine methyltransferase [Sedimentitalea xiamensis]MDK3075172.1 DNA cytosine methyltransferase [Sedimentitalea xiamensis]